MGMGRRNGLSWAMGKVITKVMMGKFLDGHRHRLSFYQQTNIIFY